ncbi:MAG: hypothetical protein ACOCUS_02265, partial [Polyangiales bacterium]
MRTRHPAAARFGGFVMLVAALAAPLVMACLDRQLQPLNPCVISGVANEIKVSTVDKVDALFTVDNSNSMQEEQATLAREFPRLVRTLASGEVTDPTSGEVVRTFPPVEDLNVGVVTSDMGTGGFTVPTCDDSADGDDGIPQTDGNTSDSGCMATYPKFLNFMPGDDVDAFASDFS